MLNTPNPPNHDPPAPVAILLLGMGGTGKSTTANELLRRLRTHGRAVEIIRFDELRRKLAPKGVDPFSSDLTIKYSIYDRAAAEFLNVLQLGKSLVIDSGLSVESIRRRLKETIASLRIVHLYCPLPVAVYRDTKRSLRGQRHERGSYLHLRALISLLNPFQDKKFPQPGVTYPFEPPECADCHVSTFLKHPSAVAEEIVRGLGL